MKIVLGILLIAMGAWIGSNVYHHRPVFSNPLVEETMLDKIGVHQSTVDAGMDSLKQHGGELMDKSRELGKKAAAYARQGAEKVQKKIAEPGH